MAKTSPPQGSRWWLERLAAGDLDPATAERVRGRLEGEGVPVGAELAAIAASNRELLASHPKEIVVAAIRRRAEARRPRGARRGLWTLATVAGAVAVMLVALRPGDRGGSSLPTGPAPLEEATPKGDLPRHAKLIVYRQRGARGEAVDARTRLGRGDVLQLAYAAGPARYGAIVSIDGRGQVTTHLPEAGAASAAPLRSAPEVRLPSAYELDDAPGFERFFLVSSPRPFDVSVVVRAAERLRADPDAARRAPLPLPEGFDQTSVTFGKRNEDQP